MYVFPCLFMSRVFAETCFSLDIQWKMLQIAEHLEEGFYCHTCEYVTSITISTHLPCFANNFISTKELIFFFFMWW